MPTIFATQILDLWTEKGYCVESYRQTTDQELRQELLNIQNSGLACAALTYRWLARQLLRDKIITPQRPAFTTDVFTKKKKERVAMAQTLYGMLSVYGPKELVPDKDSEKIHCAETVKHDFGPWTNLVSSDQNVGPLVQKIKDEMRNALAADERTKVQIKSKALRGLSHTHPWITSFDSFYNQSPDYWAYLSVKSTSFGHAMGLRYEASTGRIHFFDANTGHWAFPSWSVFSDNLLFYWPALWMEDNGGNVAEHFPDGHKFLQARLYRFRRRCQDEILDHLVFGDGNLDHYYTSGFVKS